MTCCLCQKQGDQIGQFCSNWATIGSSESGPKIATFTLNMCCALYAGGRVNRLGNFVLIELLLEARKVAPKWQHLAFYLPRQIFYILTKVSSFKTWSVVSIINPTWVVGEILWHFWLWKCLGHFQKLGDFPPNFWSPWLEASIMM